MLGISWYEFLVVLLISFVFLKPADFRKIIVAIRDFVNFFNSLIRDVTTTVEKSIALDEFKVDDFFVIDKNPSKKEQKEKDNIDIKLQEKSNLNINTNDDK